MIDTRSLAPTLNSSVADMMQDAVQPEYISTQVEIINSNRVALKVVDELGMEHDSDWVSYWKKHTHSQGDMKLYFAELLKTNLDVRPSRSSNLINISFTADNPQRAATIANAFTQTYLTLAAELRVNPAAQYTKAYEAQQKDLAKKLGEAQARLDNYQTKKGILVPDEHSADSENARLNELTTQLAAAQAKSADASSRQISSGGENSPDVLQSPIVQNLKSDITESEAKLSQISSNLGENHPQVIELKSTIARQRTQLAEEIHRVSSSLSVANRVESMKEAQLRAAIEEQRRRVLRLHNQSDELTVLVNDVENAKHAYEQMSNHISQSMMIGKTAAIDVMLLTPAEEPIRPAHPRTKLNVLISIFIGLLASIAIAIILELRAPKIRTADEVTRLLGLPILAVIDVNKAPNKK